MNQIIYQSYSQFLKNKYKEKVYKLPINLPLTCPNRINESGGCYFCSEIGTGFESLSNTLSINKQLETNKELIQKKYKAKKFIAYFQNYTNTYIDIKSFEKVVNEAVIKDVVEIAISTRPDCIREDYLKVLDNLRRSKGVNITIELGLQSVNYHTLQKINRGHTLAEFIDAVIRIKKYNFEICTHMILNLPWDNEIDVIEGAKLLSALEINQVKIHSLYIANNTKLEKQYLLKEFDIISKEEYEDRVIVFLEYLDPKIVIQRLVSRAPKDETVFCNWNTSWWLIKESIEEKMINTNTYQGRLYNYLNGHQLKKINQ